MTRIATAIGFFMMLVLSSAAADAAQFVGFGIKAGATISHMHADDVIYGSSESATGIVVGPFAEVALSPAVTFQPALVFVRRSGTFHELSASLTGSLNVVDELALRRDYLETQLLFRYGGPWHDALPLALIAGPAIGWVLDYEAVEDGSEIGQPQTEDGVALPRPSGGHDLALVLGAGIAPTRWAGRFTLDVVYRLASDGTGAAAAGSGFAADGVEVTLGLRF